MVDRMSMCVGKRVAVVTGGNRGLGLAVVRALAEAEKENIVVVLSARNAVTGNRACEDLKLPNVVFQQLDVQDSSSIARFAAWLKAEHGGLDILINNAGISGIILDEEAVAKYNVKPGQVLWDADARDKVVINDFEANKKCVDTNFYGCKRMIEALLPLLRASPSGAHIINVSSLFGQLKWLPNESLQQRLNDPVRLNQDDVDKIMEDFLTDFRAGKLEEGNWPKGFPGYKMAKICLNVFTRILAAALESRPDGQKVYVNVVDPGYVVTDMTWGTGELTPQEAADALVWVALHNHITPPSGQLFYLRKSKDFVSSRDISNPKGAEKPFCTH